MLKHKSNQALVETQQEMESLMTQFEKQTFPAEKGDVKVSLYGTMEIASLASPDTMSKPDFDAAYKAAVGDLKKARSVALVRIRNSIQKRYRVDMAKIVPEMKDAIAYLDSLKSA